MRKKIRLGLVIVVFALFFCMFGISGEESEAARKDNEEVVSLIEYETSEIGEIFEVDEAYSYLPEIAKDYVATVYEETGEIVKTEKNKEKGEVYLNPAYVEYLVLDDVVKQEQDVIPLPNIIDYDYNYNDDNKSELNLESRFSLDNIDGVSRISSLKNQGSLGVCWAFASAEQAESNIYIKKNINTKATSDYPIFSARQLDYAISIDGILNYDNSQNVTFMPQRIVGTGGTILDAPFIYSNGLATVLNNEQGMVDDYSKDKKVLSSVLNYGKSQYEINKFILFPTFNFKNENSISSTFERQQYLIEKKAFLDSIKTAIVENGGVIITTQSPQRTCEAKNMVTAYSGTRILRVDRDCQEDFGHAMQIIGWDDNYNYKYQTCYGYNQLSQGYVTGHKNEYMSCLNNIKTVSGTGAWLVRNSWGNIGNGYDYVYVAYDSLDSGMLSMADFTKMKKVENEGERKWDNVYYGPLEVTERLENYFYTPLYKDSRELSIPDGRAEKLQKIKFFAYENGDVAYTFYYTGDDGEKYYLKDKNNNNISVMVDYTGLKTVDFSDYDIVLDDSVNSIIVTNGTNGVASIIMGSVSVFTSNMSAEPAIYMPDETIALGSGAKLTNTVLSTTRAIESDSEIIYKLYDGKEKDVTSQYNLIVNDNKVAINNVNSTFSSNALSNGVYALEADYNDGAAGDFELVKVGNSNITVKYVAGPNGTVNENNVTIDAISGTPKTVTAVADNKYEFKEWIDETGRKITSQATLTAEMQKNRFGFYGEHTYTAIFDEKIMPELSVSGDYVYNKDDETVDGILDRTNVADFLSKLSVNNPFIIKVYDKNGAELTSNSMVGTGSVIKIINQNTGNVEENVTNIVRGDVNGDGRISSSDYVVVKNHIMNRGILDGIYFKAADFDKSGGISASDYVKIKNKIMQ